jgi:hypothetical protein
MASHHHEDQIFQEKRKPKSPIKFKTELNSEQKGSQSKNITTYSYVISRFSWLR